MLPWAKGLVLLHLVATQSAPNQVAFHVLNFYVLRKNWNWFPPVLHFLKIGKPRYLWVFVFELILAVSASSLVVASWNVQLVADNTYQSFFAQRRRQTIQLRTNSFQLHLSKLGNIRICPQFRQIAKRFRATATRHFVCWFLALQGAKDYGWCGNGEWGPFIWSNAPS